LVLKVNHQTGELLWWKRGVERFVKGGDLTYILLRDSISRGIGIEREIYDGEKEKNTYFQFSLVEKNKFFHKQSGGGSGEGGNLRRKERGEKLHPIHTQRGAWQSRIQLKD